MTPPRLRYGDRTRNYRALRKKFRTECERDNKPCWICRQPINYDAEWPADEAFELDHMYPRSKYPELAEDPANFRPSHRECNGRKSNNILTADHVRTSRVWVKPE